MTGSAALLDVQNLSITFDTQRGSVRALDGVSFCVERGEMLGIVGESGSGKSVSGYAIMGILERNAAVTGGTVTFGGESILSASPDRMRRLRGAEISMIFQNPKTALNQVRSVGQQLIDVITAHQNVGRRAAKALALEALVAVRISDPARRMDSYPFELSGGMAQRVMIALALACSPKLVIADEPTTGLDVTTQTVIMDLLADLQRAKGTSVIFITHDLALASDYCDRVAVMHAGQVVETAPASELFSAPGHPYTRRLLGATLHAGSSVATLSPVPGALPDLRRADLPACRFAERCDIRVERCLEHKPPLMRQTGDRATACWVTT